MIPLLPTAAQALTQAVSPTTRWTYSHLIRENVYSWVDHHQRLAKTRDIPSPQPGTILREGFLEPMGLSADALAKAIHVPRRRIDDICRARRGISANIAVRLGRSFGVDPRWFEAMQAKHDLHVQGEAPPQEPAAIAVRDGSSDTP